MDALTCGPLDLEPGETVLRLDAWVFQKSGACMTFVPGPFRWDKVSVEARSVIAREFKLEGSEPHAPAILS